MEELKRNSTAVGLVGREAILYMSPHPLKVQSLLRSHLSSFFLQFVHRNGVVHICGNDECSGEVRVQWSTVRVQ